MREERGRGGKRKEGVSGTEHSLLEADLSPSGAQPTRVKYSR